jgi:ethanolamine utilization protein EutA
MIITGEAARRDNAAKIAELFSDEAVRFVCATAGPTLETMMAAYGSGAVGKSRDESLLLLNIDLGGGTTKISVIENGRIKQTTASISARAWWLTITQDLSPGWRRPAGVFLKISAAS